MRELEELAIVAKDIQKNSIRNILTIGNVVSKYFNLDREDLNKNTRKREILQGRQVAMWLEKNNTQHTLGKIGMKYGGKDHATVLHSYNVVNNMLETNEDYYNQVKEICNKIGFDFEKQVKGLKICWK